MAIRIQQLTRYGVKMIERKLTEVARIVVRAESLDNLITKAGKHLELLMD